jgi:GGDEF domain-containing protein
LPGAAVRQTPGRPCAAGGHGGALRRRRVRGHPAPGPVEPKGGTEVARRITEALLTPFDLDGTEVTLAVSIGIAMAPKHGARPDELVRNADLALYCAKEGKGTGVNYRMFEPGMVESRNSQRRKLPRLPSPSVAAVSV